MMPILLDSSLNRNDEIIKLVDGLGCTQSVDKFEIDFDKFCQNIRNYPYKAIIFAY
jgi:hypothetical protein